MLSLMLADMHSGDGIFYIDPHGQDADRLLEYIPSAVKDEVVVGGDERERD